MSKFYIRIVAVIIGIIGLYQPLKANQAGIKQESDPLIRVRVEHPVMRLPLSLDAGTLTLSLRQLMPGEEYTLFLSNVLPAQEEKAIFKLSNQYTLLRENVIQFTAVHTDFEIQIFKKEEVRPSGSRGGSHQGKLQLTLSIACNSCREVPTARNLMGIMTDPDYSPEQLIQDVFIGGDCFDVDPSSVSFQGNNQAAGFFSNGESSINIEEGVILSTGNIAHSAGPNSAYNTGSSFLTLSNDPDLADMINVGSVYDLASLEFDFTPTTDMISFEFVFASEEYCEYVNSNFNDVFGFFVSGPGFNGPFSNNAENIAIVPGTNANIAINSVNHLVNTNYYVNNIPWWQHQDIPPYLACANHPGTSGLAIDDIEYDGFTTVMTATMNVQPCETYHIKLAIADASDAYYDSAVFLKANSFNSGGTAIVTADVPGATNASNNAFENCNDGYFIFERPIQDLSDSMTVYFSISNLSTATPGLDFEAFPDSIVIPAGDSVYYLTVDVFSDFLTEGTETLILELDVPCSCSMISTEMLISDAEELMIELENISLCEATPTTLSPQISGGVGNYTYSWSTGDTTATINVNPNSSNTYTLMVTDDCGNTGEEFSTIEIIGLPTAIISGNEQVCPENPAAELLVEFTGSGPWDFVYSLDGSPQPTITGVIDNPFLLTVQDIGAYELLSVHQNNCPGDVQGSASIVKTNFEITALLTDESCPGESDGGIDITVNGGVGPYLYLWDNGGGENEDPNNLSTGFYNLILTDANACTSEFSAEIILDANVPEVNAGLDQLLNCDVTQISLSGSGSTGTAVDILWTSNDGNIVSGATTLNPVVDQNGTYHLNITNSESNCTVSDKAEVFIDTLAPVPDIEIIGPLLIDCANPSTVLDGSTSYPLNILTFQWSTTNGNIQGPENLPAIEVNSGGTYELIVNNTENGCTANIFYTLDQDINLPDIQIQAPQLLTCKDSVQQIDATNSSTGPEFEYMWTTTNGNLLYGETTLLPAVDQPGIYFFTIYDTSNHCQITSQVEVGQDVQIPLAEAGLSIDLDCNYSIATLDGSQSSSDGVFSYNWTTVNGSILHDDFTLEPTIDAPGDYYLTVLNIQNGCSATDSVTVFENSNPPQGADIEIFPPACFGDPASLHIHAVSGGEGPYLYSIDGGVHFYSENNFWNLEPGNYELIIQDVQGCRYEDLIFIPGVPEMILTLEPEIEIELGDVYQLNAQINIPESQIDSISWSPADALSCTDCLNPIASPFENTLYSVLVINDNGCEVRSQVLVRIDPKRKIFIPNVFSPNGDGINDVFYVFGSEKAVVSINRLQVFNRWGGKLFDRQNLLPNDSAAGWDGIFKGAVLNPTVVVYIAEVEFIDGEKVIYSGDLTITD